MKACPFLQGSVSCAPNWLGTMGDQSLNLGRPGRSHRGRHGPGVSACFEMGGRGFGS